MSSMDDRFTELETRLAHFEAMADDLSAIVAEQGQRIEKLEARLKSATDRLEDLAAGQTEAPDGKPPPHY